MAVIGAGVSGIAAGRALRLAGVPFTIFEKASEAGGTWRDNVYPGLKCDIPMFAYCFSFAPGPGGWSSVLAPREEIQRQLLGVLETEGLRPSIRFNSDVVDCQWQGDHWQLRTASGEEHSFEVVVHATGWLRNPNYPEIAGLETFAGPVLHTARWDPSIDLRGKRVGVVGSGSTGVQVVSALAGTVKHLTSFQRTPQWVLPLADSPLPKPMMSMLNRSPRAADFLRRKFWEINGAFVGHAAMRDGWQRRLFGRMVRKNLETIKDPELRGRLTPKDPPLCKRPVMSATFYDTVQRPDVSVVVGAIDHVQANGLVTPDGTLHELDALVLATGYDAHAYMRPMNIVGPEGRTLDDLWADGPIAYKSIGLPGFPNMFMIMGPFVSTSHIGVQEQAEAQADYVVQALRVLSRPDVISLTPSQAATKSWLSEVRAAFGPTIWTQCSSYFVATENGLPVQFPWSRKDYFKMIETPDLSEYDVQTVGTPRSASASV